MRKIIIQKIVRLITLLNHYRIILITIMIMISIIQKIKRFRRKSLLRTFTKNT